MLPLCILEAQWGYRTIKKLDLAYTMKFGKGVKLEVFWIGIKK